MNKKILIIEDTLEDFETIRNEIVKNQELNLTDVFPRSNLADYTLNLEYNDLKLIEYTNEFSFLLDLYKEINNENMLDVFEFIFNSFSNITHYILDVNLTEQENKEGIDFYKFLLKKRIDKKNIYIVTPKKIKNLDDDIKIDHNHFILKDSAGEFGTILSKI